MATTGNPPAVLFDSIRLEVELTTVRLRYVYIYIYTRYLDKRDRFYRHIPVCECGESIPRWPSSGLSTGENVGALDTDTVGGFSVLSFLMSWCTGGGPAKIRRIPKFETIRFDNWQFEMRRVSERERERPRNFSGFLCSKRWGLLGTFPDIYPSARNFPRNELKFF